ASSFSRSLSVWSFDCRNDRRSSTICWGSFTTRIFPWLVGCSRGFPDVYLEYPFLPVRWGRSDYQLGLLHERSGMTVVMVATEFKFFVVDSKDAILLFRIPEIDDRQFQLRVAFPMTEDDAALFKRQ